MGNEDLGLHFEKTGYLEAAAEAYNRMRQDVTTTKHIIDCGIHLVNVYIARRDWTMVLNNLGKIVGVQSGEEERTYQPYTKLVSGIALLGLKHYKDAANNFLQVDFTLPPAQYNHIASLNDIAVYGGLLALATMDRQELQTRVLDNQSFRSFLEHESHVRKAISLFVNGRYSNCLAILESIRNDCLLDIYLQRHVSSLYSQIRRKCIVQYFIPFSCVTLESLNQAFAQEGESVEMELVSMIREGILKARLDIKEQVGNSFFYHLGHLLILYSCSLQTSPTRDLRCRSRHLRSLSSTRRKPRRDSVASASLPLVLRLQEGQKDLALVVVE